MPFGWTCNISFLHFWLHIDQSCVFGNDCHFCCMKTVVAITSDEISASPLLPAHHMPFPFIHEHCSGKQTFQIIISASALFYRKHGTDLLSNLLPMQLFLPFQVVFQGIRLLVGTLPSVRSNFLAFKVIAVQLGRLRPHKASSWCCIGVASPACAGCGSPLCSLLPPALCLKVTCRPVYTGYKPPLSKAQVGALTVS